MNRKRIEDILACSIGVLKGIHIETLISSVCVISILIISILPVSVGRSESEIYLCFLTPLITIIGFLSLFIRKIQLRFSWIDGVVLGWYAYAMWRLWFDASYPAAGFAIRATMMCSLYIAMRFLLSGCRLPGTVIAFLIIIFAVIEACMGYSQIISGASRHYLYPVTGSFLNPGPYSAYLAIGIVTLCIQRLTINDKRSVFATYRRFDEKFLNILIVVLSVPLAMTMSRAAFLSVFVCMLIIFRDKIKGWKQWGILITVAMLCIIFLYFLKSGSADGRGIINYIGILCFLDNPLMGNGIGSFFHRYAQKTAEINIQNPNFNLFSVDVIDYAFNDFLLVGVEQGFIGLAFATALIAIVLYRLRLICQPLFFAVLSLLIFSLFSYPFELFPYQIIMVIITSYASTNTGEKGENAIEPCNKSSRLIFSLKCLAVFIPTFFATYFCYSTIKQRIKAEKGYHLIAGLHDKAFIKDYYSLLSDLEDNKYFLFDFAKILSEQGRYNDSNDMLRRGAMISNDPMFLVLQGNNYRDMGAYELAEQAYLLAWKTMPNRIYPIYRLMKLYQTEGNIKKMIEYAEKVMDFKEKISSPTINDLKREAREIINLITNTK